MEAARTGAKPQLLKRMHVISIVVDNADSLQQVELCRMDHSHCGSSAKQCDGWRCLHRGRGVLVPGGEAAGTASVAAQCSKALWTALPIAAEAHQRHIFAACKNAIGCLQVGGVHAGTAVHLRAAEGE
jgi:hypothetical protein